MAFKIRFSHMVAAAITAGIVGWMAVGELEIGGQAANGETAPPIAEREAERSSEAFKVRYFPLVEEERTEELLVRGRTEAEAIVPVRAETAGILQRRLVDKGDRVAAGDLVCEIETASREARVAQAEASLEQAQAEFDSNQTLRKQGFASDLKVNQLNAAVKAARAALSEAEWELDRTQITANANGIVQDPIAEPGDMLSMGQACITLINPDPMLFIGQISERNVGKVETGMDARVELVTGETINGKVAYIAPSADPQTRTFRTEIRVPNPDSAIRDGLTASAHIELEPVTAFRVSPSWITLQDNGEIGLRIIGTGNKVEFVPIDILAQTKQGFWVRGPTPGMRVITVGQEYVVSGEIVEPSEDPVVKAAAEQLRSSESEGSTQ